MTENTNLAMPEDNNKNNDIDKKDDNNSLEQVLKTFMIQSTKNDEAFKDQIVKINNQVSDLSEGQNSMREEFRSFKEEYVDNLKLEEWQMDTIKEFIYNLVTNSISEKSYNNDSLRNIAYKMAYGKLKKYGYAPSGRTKRKNYETISKAMNSGTIKLSETEVIDRHRYNEWKKNQQ
ncbi:hypothetical protein NH288_05035 [Anaerococcus sp. NML200537]|uniref:hypothetical protein n=1 Tax=Anaerococcus sp. NML200537 TaxID=2954485 RepID=UPI002238E52C|nr:hypothetical protein [Anaerococcus sp. NML200537]MCW6701448.1 hypothetical protein [Anaerococcus sp. NML200537]